MALKDSTEGSIQCRKTGLCMSRPVFKYNIIFITKTGVCLSHEPPKAPRGLDPECKQSPPAPAPCAPGRLRIRKQRALAEVLQIELRTVHYYTQAGEWLGLLATDKEVHLTPRGVDFAFAEARRRPKLYAQAIWSIPLVQALLSGRGDLPTAEVIASFILENEPSMSPRTARRRATAPVDWSSQRFVTVLRGVSLRASSSPSASHPRPRMSQPLWPHSPSRTPSISAPVPTRIRTFTPGYSRLSSTTARSPRVRFEPSSTRWVPEIAPGGLHRDGSQTTRCRSSSRPLDRHDCRGSTQRLRHGRGPHSTHGPSLPGLPRRTSLGGGHTTRPARATKHGATLHRLGQTHIR